jgi:hypothetical protein
MVLPREHVRDLVVEPVAISYRGGSAQESLGATRPEAFDDVQDSEASVTHGRHP